MSIYEALGLILAELFSGGGFPVIGSWKVFYGENEKEHCMGRQQPVILTASGGNL